MKISKFIVGLGLLALINTNSLCDGLKGIQIGENMNTACDTLVKTYSDNKKIVITKSKSKCGYDSLLFGHIGITSVDNETVNSIKIPIDMFGLSIIDGPTINKDIYVASPDSIKGSVTRYEVKGGEYYVIESYIDYTVVTIDAMFITMEYKRPVMVKFN